jgi:hypothetical protein
VHRLQDVAPALAGGDAPALVVALVAGPLANTIAVGLTRGRHLQTLAAVLGDQLEAPPPAERNLNCWFGRRWQSH